MLLGSRKRPSSDDSTDSEQHKRTRHEHEPGELAAVSSTCELSDLPNELLLHILSFIPEVQYATAVSSVCRRWYRLYLASRRSLTLATARNEPAASNRGDDGTVALVSEGRSVLLRMLASCPQLREIDTADVHIIDSDVAAMAEQHPRLRRLTLFSCNRLTDSSLASISHFQRLRALTMRFALCIPATAWHSLLRQRSFVCSLESFSSTLAQIDDEAVEAFVHNASPERLSSLHLSVCTLVTGASLALLALHHPQLKSLDFPAPHATDAQLTLMCERMTRLEQLQLWSATNLTPTHVASMSTSLRELYLPLAGNAPAIVSTIAEHLVGLRKLLLNIDGRLTLTDVEPLVERLALLELLEIECRRGIEADAVSCITRLTQLQTLRLTACVDLSDTTLMRLARSLQRLSALELGPCHNITDCAMYSVATSGSPHLTRLMLLGARSLDDRAVSRLALAPRKLLEFTLEESQISDRGVASLAHSFPSLRLLSLALSSQLSSACISTFLLFPKLRHLRITGCQGITDDALPLLCNLTQLESLSLGHMPLLSQQSIETLKATLPNLTVISF